MALTGGHRLDGPAVAEGAVATLALVLLAWVVDVVKRGDLPGRESNLWAVAVAIVLVAPVVGGIVAGRRRPRAALVHGAWSGAAAFAVIAVVGLVWRLVGGDRIGRLLVTYLFFLILYASLGTVGGYVAFRRHAGGRA